ncbi:MAG: hypothetical protein GX659_05180, partial [Myxococcales bacterium]|nr:hypothetical protein [Myxococcales bacterium]
YATTGGVTLTSGDGVKSVTVKFRDLAGNESAVASDSITLDTVLPVITSITSPIEDGHYREGTSIEVRVGFNKNVTLSGGGIIVTLNTDGTFEIAELSNSNIGTGTYVVRANDTSAALAVSSFALSPGATVSDAAGNEVTLSVPVSNFSGRAIVIDTTPPAAPVVSGSALTNNQRTTWSWIAGDTTGNGTFRYQMNTEAGEWIETESTSYTPELNLEDGTHTLYVQERDSAGNWSASGSFSTTIDTSVPTILHITSSADDGHYKSGDQIEVIVNFSKNVTLVGGDLTITLETGAVDRTVVITEIVNETQGSGIYTVQDGDESADLAASSVTLSILATLTDEAGNDASLAIPQGGNISDVKNIVIDTVPPLAPAVTSIASITGDATPTWSWSTGGGGNGTFRYHLNNGVWSEETTATSFTPESDLADDEHTLYVQERDDAGNWSENGHFTLTVDTSAPIATISGAPSNPSNDTSLNVSVGGIGVLEYSYDLLTGAENCSAASYGEWTVVSTPITSEIGEDGEKILCVRGRDEAGNIQTDPTSHSWTNKTTAPIASLSGTPSGSSKAISLDVTISGDGVSHYRHKVGAAGSTSCSVEEGYSSEQSAGLKITSDISGIPDGSIRLCVISRDVVGNWQGFDSATEATWTKDTVAPSITGAALTSDNLYLNLTASEGIFGNANGSGAVETDDFTINFTRNDGSALSASIVGISNLAGEALEGGESSIRFHIFVDGTPSGSESIEITPADATSVYDAAGNPMSITETSGAKTLADRKSPTVTNVSSDSDDGIYIVGDGIDIVVTFSEPVFVEGGVPTITMETGETDREATYLSGSGSSALTFRYIVQDGDTSDDLDYASTDAISLVGATVRDEAGNDAILTLPIPGTTGSLSANKNIVLETTVQDGPEIVVNELGDDDGQCYLQYCTLRQALASASAGDRITFHSAISGNIILSSPLSVAEGITIDGEANGHSHDIVVSGANTGDTRTVDCFELGSANTIKGLVIQGCRNAIIISGEASGNNKIQNNIIGVSSDETTPTANDVGILISDGSTSNIIGADFDGNNDLFERNIIAYNSVAGIKVSGAATTGNLVRLNSIYSNSGNGIVIAEGSNDGILAPSDLAQNDLETPLHDMMSLSGAPVRSGGMIDIYIADDAENCEGITYLGTTSADEEGNWSFTLVDVYNDPGTIFTVTQSTGSSGTSAFSDCIVIENQPPVAKEITVSGTMLIGGELTATYKFSDANGDEEDGTVVVWKRSSAQDGEYEEITGTDGSSVYTLSAPDDSHKWVIFSTVPSDGLHSGDEYSSAPQLVDNTPPIISDVEDIIASESDTVEFTLTADDADLDDLTWDCNGSDEICTRFTQSGNDFSFSWATGYDDEGVYSATIGVDDGHGGYDERNLHVTVVQSNRAPEISPVQAKNVAEGETLSFTITASDPDGDAVSLGFSAVQGELIGTACSVPSGAMITRTSDTTFTFTWTPGYDDAGFHCVNIEATDNGSPSLSSTLPIAITVSNTNRPPVIESIPNLTAAENETITFQVSVSDPDGDDLTTSMSSTAIGNYKALPQAASYNASTRTFTWTPTENDLGSYIAMIRADDSGTPSLSDTISVVITVSNINRAPSIRVYSTPAADENGHICVALRERVNMVVNGTDPDAGDSLSITLSPSPSGSSFADYASNSKSFSWAPQSTGVTTLVFTVTDAGGLNASAARTILAVSSESQCKDEIERVNDPDAARPSDIDDKAVSSGKPTARACFGELQKTGGVCVLEKVVASGKQTHLDGSNSYQPALNDKGESVLSKKGLVYHWTQTGGTALELSDNNSQSAIQPSFTAPQVEHGTAMALTFDLVVENSFGKSAPHSVALMVVPDSRESEMGTVPMWVLGQSGDTVITYDHANTYDQDSDEDEEVDGSTSAITTTTIAAIDPKGSILNLGSPSTAKHLFSISIPSNIITAGDISMKKASSGFAGQAQYVFGLPTYDNERGAIVRLNSEQIENYSSTNGAPIINISGDERFDIDKVSGASEGSHLGSGLEILDFNDDGTDDIVTKVFSGSEGYIVGLSGGNLIPSNTQISEDMMQFRISGSADDIRKSRIVGSRASMSDEDIGYSEGPTINMTALGKFSMSIDVTRDLIQGGYSDSDIYSIFTLLSSYGRAVDASGFHDLGAISLGSVSQSNYSLSGERVDVGHSKAFTVSSMSATTLSPEEMPDPTNIANGDINGDGHTDTVVGDPEAGYIYVFLGNAMMSGARDSNLYDVRIACAKSGEECGRVVLVGDITGDKYDDIIIGAPAGDGEFGATHNAGAIYIVYGTPDLPEEIDIADYSGSNIIYGTVEEGWLGLNMALVDANLNGTKELVCNLRNGSAVVTSFDLIRTLGRTLRIEQLEISENSFVDPEKMVLLSLKLSASTEEDLKVQSLTLSASGTGVGQIDPKSVSLYEDVNADGVLDAGDRKINATVSYNGKEGTIDFSDINEIIAKGSNNRWLVVYEFEYGSNSEVQMTIAPRSSSGHHPASVPMILIAITITALTMRRCKRFGLVLVACTTLTSMYMGCSALNQGATEIYTYQISISEGTKVKAVGSTSGESASVIGAPVSGPTMMVTFTNIPIESGDMSEDSEGGGCGMRMN